MLSNKRDKYVLSEGNLIVLRTIPLMMKNNRWRKKLRLLVLDYILDNEKGENQWKKK